MPHRDKNAETLPKPPQIPDVTEPNLNMTGKSPAVLSRALPAGQLCQSTFEVTLQELLQFPTARVFEGL